MGGRGARPQVLLNLVTNAVKFTSEGEIVIRASRERRGDGAAWLRLAVSDTGIGIAPEAVDRLFDAFEQADSSTTRKYGGTGLGLAISRQLVELMGGEIAVTSEPGSGSTFSFHLPLEPARGGVPATPVPDLADRRALVVDDNETNRTILARQLTSWHTRCDVAASGHEALGMLSQAAAAGDPYEIVLLDFNMPGLSGVDVARAVTANPVLGRARIVLLSSSTQRREAEQAGVHGHLTKPVSRARLRREICRVIGERPADAAEEAPAPAERSAEVDGGNRRILVVEDHVVNQRVAVSLLERRGFRVDVAGNGLEALDHHARTDYDAIFMDCQMPEMDGYEATVELRRREGRGRRTPIVAMTAHALSGDRERCLAVGMDDYISKPLRPEDFDAALARVVGSEPPVEAGEPVAPDGNGARELPVLDWEALADVVAGDYELRERLVELFVEQGERALAELDAAVAEGDAEGVKKLAHGLKGSSATMAARRLAAISEQLYRTGLGDELAPAAPRLLAELHEAFARTSDALRSVRR